MGVEAKFSYLKKTKKNILLQNDSTVYYGLLQDISSVCNF